MQTYFGSVVIVVVQRRSSEHPHFVLPVNSLEIVVDLATQLLRCCEDESSMVFCGSTWIIQAFSVQGYIWFRIGSPYARVFPDPVSAKIAVFLFL